MSDRISSVFSNNTHPFSSTSGGSQITVPIRASTESRPEESRSLRAFRWQRRNERARRKTRWRTRIEAVAQTADRVRVVSRHDIDGDDIQGALDAAVEEITMLMTPLTTGESKDRSNRRYADGPLAEDVSFVWAGKVLAVARATGGTPAIHLFFPFITQRLFMFNDRFRGRRSLREIVRGGVGDLQRVWDQTEAAAGFDPVPSGIYRVLVDSGDLTTSRSNGTPGLKLRMVVLDGEHRGRRLFHDIWLTADSMSRAKYELGQLGITQLDQLDRALPPGLIAEVVVSCRNGDDGVPYNKVRSLKAIPPEVPVDGFAPPATDEGTPA